ncbi:ATPase WRNIP1-like [Chelonus insularis]|uniref:ATPase WRNIP1-like n=1 Tax=Chelonus insularis TaxID=460826 RepID=UPI00158A4D67|nr:ATPase WRNIP1-like [Chelonus insularis]
MMESDVECPICSKHFPKTIIEVHVSKCLFLNESSSTDSQLFLKRPRTDNSPKMKNFNLIKKPKKSNGGNQTFLTPSTLSEKRNTNDNSLNNEKNTESSTSSLKPELSKSSSNYAPLAEKMRPTSLLDYVGQSHILGKQSMLLQLLNKGEIPNIILWGPPGCGKTSLANIIANKCKGDVKKQLRFVKLSAAVAGVSDVKEATTIAANELKFGRRTIVFMDEIHRFNKLQQDIFLPHVESGTITLIGATTENPSFSLNSALLSRCRVIVLEKLSVENLTDILTRTVKSLKGVIFTNSADINNLSEVPRFLIDEKTIEFLAETCDGDARIALGGLELAVQSYVPEESEFSTKGPGSISLADIREGLKKSHMLYDKRGDQHYDMISALHKSVRASDENASLYWLARMMAGGEDPVYIARRMVRMACEDVGLKDPKALGIAVHTMHACKMIGMPECDVILAQCAIYLARAPKSRLMEDALRAAQRVIANHKGPQPGVPLHLRNAPTKMMKELGYGQNYNMMDHNESGLTYLPEGLEHLNFFS